MKKHLYTLLIISLFLFSTVTMSSAGYRHGFRSYNYSYSNHHHTGYWHNRVYSRSHYYRSNDVWTSLGIGLLTGVLVGSFFSTPPRPQTVYYTPPARVIVQSEPIIVRQQFLPSVPLPELVLSQVRIITEIVNIRSGPGLENAVINQIHQHETVDVIGAAPEWLYVKTADGRYGWLMMQYTHEIARPMG